MQRQMGVGHRIVEVHRALITTEGRLAEALASSHVHVVHPVAASWITLQDHLQLYARDFVPGGLLMLAGRPDAGSRITGIPFTGPPQAREHLDLSASPGPASASGERFWRSVGHVQAAADGAPVASLLGTVMLAHARPLAFSTDVAEVLHAEAMHVRSLLAATRPQVVVAVGPDALTALGAALDDPNWAAIASAHEADWLERWPVRGSLMRHPTSDVPARPTFRTRVVPVPMLCGPHAEEAEAAITRILAYAWT